MTSSRGQNSIFHLGEVVFGEGVATVGSHTILQVCECMCVFVCVCVRNVGGGEREEGGGDEWRNVRKGKGGM